MTSGAKSAGADIRWDGYPTDRVSSAWEMPDPTDKSVKAALENGLMHHFSKRGWRFQVRASGGSGTVDRVKVRNGIQMSVTNCTLPKVDSRVYDADEPITFMYASLAGDVRFRVDNEEPVIMDRPELTLINVPQGMRLNIEILGGVRQQRIFAMFRRGEIASLLGIPSERLPETLNLDDGESARFGRLISIPLDHKVAALVADTIDTNLNGEMRALQYEGRLLELVAFLLQALNTVEGQDGALPSGLKNQRDADLAERTLARLSKEYNKTPDLEAMARQFGTNSSKLRATFKTAYGMTMSEYCMDKRMREAQKLLLEDRLSIAQIAEAVGYEYHSGFSSAFTRYIGVTPKKYREQRAPINMSLPERPKSGD